MNISDSLRAVKITKDSNVIIFKSNFANFGNKSVIYGKAIQLDNSNLSLNTTVFTHWKARQGAWIALMCNSNHLCSYSITNSNFTDNAAVI